jgi:hypothetical protein
MTARTVILDHLRDRGRAYAGALLVISLAGCSGQAAVPSAAPSLEAPGSSPVLQTPAASDDPAAEELDFKASAAAFAKVNSYQFTVLLSTGTAPSAKIAGVVVLRPSRSVTFTMSGGTSSETTTYTVIGERAWMESTSSSSGLVELTAADANAIFAGWEPSHLIDTSFATKGSVYKRVGKEQRNGVAVIHYTASPATVAKNSAPYGKGGRWSADLWVAARGGYVISSVAEALSADVSIPGYRVALDLTHVDDPANKVAAPGP